jgi:predicted MFS family arabinose efflux permease
LELEVSAPEKSMNWRILVSLIFARLSARPHYILVSILLVDIANSFQVPVGVMSQIRSLSSIVTMVFSIIMGVLSIKYKPKPLLMIGLLLFIVASVGCSVARTYPVMLFIYALTGVGNAMIIPSSQAIVGEFFDLDNRAKAISYMLMSFTLVSALVSSPVINQLAVWGGWRLSLLGYALPGGVIGLLFAYFGIPRSKTEIEEEKTQPYIVVFKEILSDRSALACIVCAALGTASFTSVGTYGVSSFVERFDMSPGWRAPMWSIMTFTGALGSYISGLLVAKFGRRPVTLVSSFIMGILTICFMNINGFWAAGILITLNGIAWTIWFPAATSLTLEQNPRYRGSIMSLNEASRSFGMALGVSIGGLVLLQFGYGYLGLALGGMGIIASSLYFLFSIDPTIQK